jgi:alkanesulfonate monooxygenase SsuD/methylene tetrahydromethanopterin reductase-like flavin-dependent oxidoreductase (luciferase family)
MRVGICIPISERGPDRALSRYSEMRELAVTTEQAGLDSIWVADHLFFIPPDGSSKRGVWESLTMLAAMADATSRVELGPLVLCTPFRNPGLIAWTANTLDEISGGRFVLGLGAGWHAPEFEAFGFEFEKRVTFFEDALNIVVPLLRDNRVDYEGRLTNGHAQLRPAGPRSDKGGPPILIAGTKPRMMRLIAEWADRWNSVWWGLPNDDFRAERESLFDACQARDREASSIEVTVGVAIHDPATRDANDDKGLVGDVEHLAEALISWRDEGVAEVMCRLEPPSVGIIETIAEARARAR